MQDEPEEKVAAAGGGLSRRVAMMITGAAALGTSWAEHAVAQAAATAAGSVGFLKGEAAAETEGRRRPLGLKESVFVNDVVSTGQSARLMLQLGQRTTLRLGGDTRLKIESYLMDAGGEFELGTGAIQFERTGKPAASELKIRSAYGLIAVRGTRFFAGPSKGVFGVLVGTGAVEVTSGGRTVTVRAQQGIDIAKPGDPPTDPKPWGPPRIQAALASVR